jgi:hypothetical protein
MITVSDVNRLVIIVTDSDAKYLSKSNWLDTTDEPGRPKMRCTISGVGLTDPPVVRKGPPDDVRGRTHRIAAVTLSPWLGPRHAIAQGFAGRAAFLVAPAERRNEPWLGGDAMVVGLPGRQLSSTDAGSHGRLVSAAT